MEISSDSKWGSRLVKGIMLDVYYTHTINLEYFQEKTQPLLVMISSMKNNENTANHMEQRQFLRPAQKNYLNLNVF